MTKIMKEYKYTNINTIYNDNKKVEVFEQRKHFVSNHFKPQCIGPKIKFKRFINPILQYEYKDEK